MDDFPRRRRLSPQEPKKGGGIPLFPLIVLVIFTGILLGGLVGKFLNRGGTVATPAPTFTPLPVATATFAPRASAHRTPESSPSASISPSPTPTASTASSPSAKPSLAASATPTSSPSVIYITPQPKASAAKTPVLKTPTPMPVATAAPSAAATAATPISGHAESIVRSYMAAVLRGDEATATSYLAHGLPNESFYTGSARITDLEVTRNADGSTTVAADISSPSGEYYETFKLAEGPGGLGLQITDHYAIKVQ